MINKSVTRGASIPPVTLMLNYLKRSTSITIYSPVAITDSIKSKFKPTRLYIKELAGIKYFGKTISDPYKYDGSGQIWKCRIKKYGAENIKTIWVSDVYTDPSLIQEDALAFSRSHDIVNSAEWANLIPENGITGGFLLTAEIIAKRTLSKFLNGNMNTNTPESIQKSLNTKRRNGTLNVQTPESVAKANATKLKNGTLNPNTPESIQKGLETKRRNGYKAPAQSAESIAKANATKLKNGTNKRSKESIEKQIATIASKGGRIQTEETRQKLRKPKNRLQCPHCNQEGGSSQMKRWHFDKCKLKAI